MGSRHGLITWRRAFAANEEGPGRPGTSKWNKVEHRLFSHITMNWRGQPLTSHEVIVNTIAATTTRAGLTVRADGVDNDLMAGQRLAAESEKHTTELQSRPQLLCRPLPLKK